VEEAKGAKLNERNMPRVAHNKIPGSGYNPGSPLYDKQQQEGTTLYPPARPLPLPAGYPYQDRNTIIHVTAPPPDQVANADHWWRVHGGWWGHLTRGWSFFFGLLIDVFLIALIWDKCLKGRGVKGIGERNNTEYNFAYPLFSLDHCCRMDGHHCNVCFCAWCCPLIRLADTYSKLPSPIIGGFYVALLLLCCLAGFSQLTFGLTELFLLLLAVHCRQRLRKQYKLLSGNVTYCEDCFIWCFCPFCAIAQEARQVEYVLKPEGTK
jgi:Cys-rich protein (TIGR01571 family)